MLFILCLCFLQPGAKAPVVNRDLEVRSSSRDNLSVRVDLWIRIHHWELQGTQTVQCAWSLWSRAHIHIKGLIDHLCFPSIKFYICSSNSYLFTSQMKCVSLSYFSGEEQFVPKASHAHNFSLILQSQLRWLRQLFSDQWSLFGGLFVGPQIGWV
jgi:hypothetical protein